MFSGWYWSIGRQNTTHDIRESVDITQSWIGDLRVELIAPSGRAVTLHDRSWRGADNIIRSFKRGGLPALEALVLVSSE